MHLNVGEIAQIERCARGVDPRVLHQVLDDLSRRGRVGVGDGAGEDHLEIEVLAHVTAQIATGPARERSHRSRHRVRRYPRSAQCCCFRRPKSRRRCTDARGEGSPGCRIGRCRDQPGSRPQGANRLGRRGGSRRLGRRSRRERCRRRRSSSDRFGWQLPSRFRPVRQTGCLRTHRQPRAHQRCRRGRRCWSTSRWPRPGCLSPGMSNALSC